MKRKNKKLKCELYYEECNPSKEALNKALLDLLIVLGDGERERLLLIGDNLFVENKKTIEECTEAIALLEKLKDNYKEFESHHGVKNSQIPKRHNTKGEMVHYKTFEL